jgi:hypothetical protein
MGIKSLCCKVIQDLGNVSIKCVDILTEYSSLSILDFPNWSVRNQIQEGEVVKLSCIEDFLDVIFANVFFLIETGLNISVDLVHSFHALWIIISCKRSFHLHVVFLKVISGFNNT